MQQKEEAGKGEIRRVSRREFLRDTGLVVGSAAVGSIALIGSSCGSTKTVTQSQVSTVTMPAVTMTAVISGSAVVKTVTITNPPVTITQDNPAVSPLAQTVVVNVPTNFTITAEKMAFDQPTITVTAFDSITFTLINKDVGVVHNLSVYTDSTATTPIFKGPPVTGPGSVVFTIITPNVADTYYFQCDTHPKMMNGYFVVYDRCN